MRRLTVRRRASVHKKLLLQAMVCNLALLLRALYGAGKPKAASEGAVELLFALWRLFALFLQP
ncbi:MAG TPA: hypothetical protein VNJ11_11895 [Bryobacteraceae bacterium]|nr:hypothetical protein [Bryobacteraceae bacterium]